MTVVNDIMYISCFRGLGKLDMGAFHSTIVVHFRDRDSACTATVGNQVQLEVHLI